MFVYISMRIVTTFSSLFCQLFNRHVKEAEATKWVSNKLLKKEKIWLKQVFICIGKNTAILWKLKKKKKRHSKALKHRIGAMNPRFYITASNLTLRKITHSNQERTSYCCYKKYITGKTALVSFSTHTSQWQLSHPCQSSRIMWKSFLHF